MNDQEIMSETETRALFVTQCAQIKLVSVSDSLRHDFPIVVCISHDASGHGGKKGNLVMWFGGKFWYLEGNFGIQEGNYVVFFVFKAHKSGGNSIWLPGRKHFYKPCILICS